MAVIVVAEMLLKFTEITDCYTKKNKVRQKCRTLLFFEKALLGFVLMIKRCLRSTPRTTC